MSRHVGRSGIPVMALAVGICLMAPGCVLTSTFEEKTNALASDIASVRTTADANTAGIRKIVADIKDLQTRVAALDATVKGLLTLEPRVGQTERLLTSHTTKLGELETAARDAGARIAALDQRVGRAATKESVDKVAKDLDTKIAAQTVEMGRLSARFKRITAMSDQVIQDLERVKEAQTKLDSTMRNLKSWAKTSVAAQDKIITEGRKTLVSILEAEYATLGKRMKELQDAISKLRSASALGGAAP